MRGRKPDQKERSFFFDRFADQFDARMNRYDLQRRIEIVFDELLNVDIKGKSFLDAGAGTGWFSLKASEMGADVVALDIGHSLLKQVLKKKELKVVVSSITDLCFPDNRFEVVVSSEVIEHTPSPDRAVRELYRVLAPGGTLIITTPNKVWKPSVFIAGVFHLRPYEGLENWLSWGEIREILADRGAKIEVMRGFHLLPFQLRSLHPLIRWFDRFGESLLGRLMINTAVRVTKPVDSSNRP